jgi:hypothetical protein
MFAHASIEIAPNSKANDIKQQHLWYLMNVRLSLMFMWWSNCQAWQFLELFRVGGGGTVGALYLEQIKSASEFFAYYSYYSFNFPTPPDPTVITIFSTYTTKRSSLKIIKALHHWFHQFSAFITDNVLEAMSFVSNSVLWPKVAIIHRKI